MKLAARARSIRIHAILATAALVTAVITSCSQFSLYDKFPSVDQQRSSSAGSLSISPASAVVTTSTTVAFTASGGTSPYSFSVTSGGGTIDTTSGVYSAPDVAGSATVRVTDAAGAAATSSVTILAITPSTQLTISPGSISMSAATGITFTASGGNPPYTYTIASGGGTIDSNTGYYQAPATAGSATITVTDTSSGTSSASVQIDPSGGGMAISPASATIVANSTLSFAGNSGTPPYTFTLVSGSGSIDPSSGVYHAPGTAGTATVRVTDALSATSDASVTVLAPSSTVAIYPVVPAVTVGGTVNFTASGGSPAYTYTVLPGGAGGTIDPTTGVYVAPISPGTDTVRVTDKVGGISDATVTIVAASQLVISPSTLTIAVGNTYQFGATGGVPPYTFSLFSGGASVSSDGLYTASGSSSTATLRVTDAVNATSDATVTVVSGGPLAISPASAAVPEGGTVTFAGSGGSPAYVFSLTGAGSVGVYSGTYTASGPVGANTATIKMSDTLAASVTATIDIVPAAPTALTATGAGPHTINLAWTNNTASANAVVVERKLASGGSYAVIATLASSANTYSDTDSAKPPNTLYVYRVRATASSGTLVSPYSNEAYGVTTS